MIENLRSSIQIDLNEFKLHIFIKRKTQLTLHFNTPSRKFYLSVIALVVNEMKKLGKIKSILLQDHIDLLALLNESVGGAAGSSDKRNLLPRIYRKWKDALPNLEEGSLFRVLGKKKEEGDGAIGKIYSFSDTEKDIWANLFEYMGSDENVRLKFAVDKMGMGLEEISIKFKDCLNVNAWDQFISSLKQDKKETPEADDEIVPTEKSRSRQPPIVPPCPSEKRKISRILAYRLVVMAIVIGVAAGVIWKVYPKLSSSNVASVDRMKHPLPDWPSIAVLPFVNMSEDPKQEFLGDGITDSIITALSKVPRIFVIARNSTFVYKSKPVKVKDVSEELGVRYILEGSIQRSGDRVRVTSQLIDALTGNHIWAERYERDLKDIFALQDEITLRILTGIQVKLTEGEQASLSEKGYGKYLGTKKGLDCYLKEEEAMRYVEGHNIEDVRMARRIAEDAVNMCPESAGAYYSMACVYLVEYWIGAGKSSPESLEAGIEMARKAISIDDSNAKAHTLLGNFYAIKRDYDKAIAEGQRAIALSPGSANAYEFYGQSLNYAGRSEEAIPLLQKAIRLNPVSPTQAFLFLGHAFRMTRRYEEAASAFKKALERAPENILAHLALAGTYVMMGRENEARAEAAEVLRINPKFSLDHYASLHPHKHQSETDRYINALGQAGLK